MTETAGNASPDGAASQAVRVEQRRNWLMRLGLVAGVAAIAWGSWYLLIGRHYVSTDNAYVNAEMAEITPLISAAVVAVKVRETQPVHVGDVLIELDPANPRLAVAEATARLTEARRRFRQTVATNRALSAAVMARTADTAQARARLNAASAEFEKARIDLERRETLAPKGLVSAEALTDARKAFASARAAVATAEAAIAAAQSTKSSAEGELAANEALIHGSTEDTDPGVLAALAALQAAELDLERTVLRAPIDGVVTRRAVQIGELVTEGKPLMTIIPVDRVYIDANFKERQLRRVKVGMPATVTADIYGRRVTYDGKVTGIAGGTGASMALIPAQNATGNWIKVVQRLPVRIELDREQLARHPLRVGLSTEVEIDLSGS